MKKQWSAWIGAGVLACSGFAVFAAADEYTDHSAEALNASAEIVTGEDETLGSGPDVVVSAMVDTQKYGVVGGITGYALGTTSCNIGTSIAEWFETTNRHPVIAQNLYRIKNGRFEQVGIGWLKHGWCAADGGSCAGAGGPPSCSSAAGCNWLGVGCTDTYGAGLNGTQSDLGPRSEINAWSGAYPYPYILGWNASGNAIYKRMQVKDVDLDPSQNAGAIYLGEGHYICTDEPTYHRNNNASWRRVTVGTTYSSGWPISFTGGTTAQKAAIEAWPTFDASATVVDAIVPNEGRFILGYKVTNNGNGTWSYEYALFNMNSDRAAGSFSVPAPSGVNLTSIGFKDVDYHSGEPYSGTDWTSSVAGGAITWATQTHAENVNANALRWSTLYNFRFVANSAPEPAALTIGLFKPGTPASISVNAVAPAAVGLPGDMNCDGVVTPGDIAGFLLALTNPAQYAIEYPNCNIDNGDINGDGVVTPGDIAGFVDLLTN